MLLYAFGTLLFALGFVSALIVMSVDFARYRHAMMAALRSLSLDGLPHTPPAVSQADEARVIPAFPWALQPLRNAGGHGHS